MSRQPRSRGTGKPQRAFRYLLGYSRTEAARLRAQARLWDPTAFALFDRLGIGRGWRVLELGPGEGSLHMELRRRVGGPVDAVERSAAVCAALRKRSGRDGLGQGRTWQADLREVELPRGEYDLVFARWVLLFVPDPMTIIGKLASALKPGGLLAIEDYHRETLALVPLPPEWPAFLAADAAFFASQGGDASVGARLPDLYRKAGLEMVEIVPTIKTGRPGSPVWTWLSTYFLGVMSRLGGVPPFSPGQAASLRRRWLAAARWKTSLLIGPALLDVVGRKPAGGRRRSGRKTD